MYIILLVGGSFFLAGLHTLLWCRRRRRLAEQAMHWPVTIGRVVKSHMVYARPKMDESDALVFLYRYEIGDLFLSGKTIDLTRWDVNTDSKWAEEMVRNYPVGSQVNVHYHPDDPWVSVLEPASRGAYAAYRRMGVAMMGVGLLVLAMLGADP